ncbi:MAG: SGNH/GDSL hydrolase family protein [Defluviitaleaceae bacterium]|nr:SGNH/GDSL hydrolase family protein [Defluviitaleaceae bacterium]
MKRTFIFVIILCAAFALAACSSRRGVQDEDGYSYDYAPAPVVERLVYIALGDSVSEGYGIWTMANRHTAVFFEMLRTQGYANEYVNMATSGFTTADLLRRLNGLDDYALEYFRYATVITLNIGGNNILAPIWAQLPDTGEVERIVSETIAFATDTWALITDVMDFMNDSQQAIMDVLDFANEIIDFAGNFTFMDIFRLNEMLTAAPPLIDGAISVFEDANDLEAAAMDMFQRVDDLDVLQLVALFTGGLPADLAADFRASVEAFADDFVQILTWLEANAPNAIVVINTVYNPLPSDFMGMPVVFINEAAQFIHDINRTIYEETRARGFIVSDVYAQLSQRVDLMHFSFDIIHPNAAGHDVIAQLNFADFIAR